ncbi:hypothetical protein T492DRAFT_891440 [Pavlovales sp. CCMP2436]|nr:hypothetical protein T492DRAFT_891440 [Pavlovales sp. CCMP2436]
MKMSGSLSAAGVVLRAPSVPSPPAAGVNGEQPCATAGALRAKRAMDPPALIGTLLLADILIVQVGIFDVVSNLEAPERVTCALHPVTKGSVAATEAAATSAADAAAATARGCCEPSAGASPYTIGKGGDGHGRKLGGRLGGGRHSEFDGGEAATLNRWLTCGQLCPGQAPGSARASTSYIHLRGVTRPKTLRARLAAARQLLRGVQTTHAGLRVLHARLTLRPPLRCQRSIT